MNDTTNNVTKKEHPAFQGSVNQPTNQPTNQFKINHIKLTFSYHIKDISKRASQKVGVLLRLRNLIPCSAKLRLYKSAILPHLTYCGTVWHFCKSSDRRKLERIQERALRAVFKSKTESYSDLLKRASLPTLLQRRIQKIATLMYKVKMALYRTTYQSYFRQLLKDTTSEMLTLTSLVLVLHTTVNTLCVFSDPIYGVSQVLPIEGDQV